MKVVLQRVTSASVTINGDIVGRIDRGLLILIGVGQGDTENEAKWLAEKTVGLRVFQDEAGKMNRSLVDIEGGALIVSQFTLLADCRKGRRPAFTDAAEPSLANQLYLSYAQYVADHDIKVQTGVFAADMQVASVNDGPVTIILERRRDIGLDQDDSRY